MLYAPLYPPSKRIEVAALMRGSDLSAAAVAERSGVGYVTVCRWNRRHGWRPSVARKSLVAQVRGWPQARLAALERVLLVPGVDPADLAEVLGSHRARAEALFTRLGLDAETGRPDPHGTDRAGREGRVPSKAALSRRLRVHVGRQIAAFDRRLSRAAHDPDDKLDSVRVLRDLVGLKGIIDGLEAEPAASGSAVAEAAPADIAALRAEILRRYEAFERAENEAEAAAFELPVFPDASSRTPACDDAPIP